MVRMVMPPAHRATAARAVTAGVDSRVDLPSAALSRCQPAVRRGRVLEKLIIQKTLRVPASTGGAGGGTTGARPIGAGVLGVGVSASRGVLGHVGNLAPGAGTGLAASGVST